MRQPLTNLMKPSLGLWSSSNVDCWADGEFLCWAQTSSDVQGSVGFLRPFTNGLVSDAIQGLDGHEQSKFSVRANYGGVPDRPAKSEFNSLVPGVDR